MQRVAVSHQNLRQRQPVLNVRCREIYHEWLIPRKALFTNTPINGLH